MLPALLMWNKVGRIITRLAARLGVSPERAVDVFYTSNTCDLLYKPETGLYAFGDLYIVDEIIRELELR